MVDLQARRVALVSGAENVDFTAIDRFKEGIQCGKISGNFFNEVYERRGVQADDCSPQVV